VATLKYWTVAEVYLHTEDEMLDAVKRNYPACCRAEIIGPALFDWTGVEQCFSSTCSNSRRPVKVAAWRRFEGREVRMAVLRVCPECLSTSAPD
jgi:hypothetical protein